MTDFGFDRLIPALLMGMLLLGALTLFAVGAFTPVQTQWNGVGGGNTMPALLAVSILPIVLGGLQYYLRHRQSYWEEDRIGNTMAGVWIVMVVCSGAQFWICVNAINTVWNIW